MVKISARMVKLLVKGNGRRSRVRRGKKMSEYNQLEMMYIITLALLELTNKAASIE
jgi:hypothetical protein